MIKKQSGCFFGTLSTYCRCVRPTCSELAEGGQSLRVEMKPFKRGNQTQPQNNQYVRQRKQFTWCTTTVNYSRLNIKQLQ